MVVVQNKVDEDQISTIFNTYCNYFQSEKQHPYFKSTEKVMNQFGASYFYGITKETNITMYVVTNIIITIIAYVVIFVVSEVACDSNKPIILISLIQSYFTL